MFLIVLTNLNILGTYLVYRSLPQFIIFYVKLRAATAMYVFVSLYGGVVEADSTVE